MYINRFDKQMSVDYVMVTKFLFNVPVFCLSWSLNLFSIYFIARFVLIFLHVYICFLFSIADLMQLENTAFVVSDNSTKF